MKRHIRAQRAITINVSQGRKSLTYYHAYSYVTKTDGHFLSSPGHPDKTEMPQTSTALQARNGKKKKKQNDRDGVLANGADEEAEV